MANKTPEQKVDKLWTSYFTDIPDASVRAWPVLKRRVLELVKGYDELYAAANCLVAAIGAEGEIHSQHPAVNEVMDVLYDIDNNGSN